MCIRDRFSPLLLIDLLMPSIHVFLGFSFFLCSLGIHLIVFFGSRSCPILCTCLYQISCFPQCSRWSVSYTHLDVYKRQVYQIVAISLLVLLLPSKTQVVPVINLAWSIKDMNKHHLKYIIINLGSKCPTMLSNAKTSLLSVVAVFVS